MSEECNQIDMHIRVGLIGPEPLLKRFADVLKSFPSFLPIYKQFESETEASSLCRELSDKVDVFVFSGPSAYHLAKRDISFPMPTVYVNYNGSGLYRSLLQLQHRDDWKSLSIDSMTENEAANIFEDTGIFPEKVFIVDSGVVDEEALIAFHKQSVETDKNTFVLTGNYGVMLKLSAVGIGCEWIVPTEQDIHVTLERALLATETRRRKEGQIVVGFIHVDEPALLIQGSIRQENIQKLRLRIHNTIIGYVESISGFLANAGSERFLFFTTRGTFERETGGYRIIPLAREAEKSLGISLSMGVGFGVTPYEAGMHARHALRQAKEAGGNSCYIIREDRSQIGPIEMTKPLEHNLTFLEVDVIQKAQRTGLTASFLSKFTSHVSVTGQTDYTAQEIANVLGVTVRSAHRFLLQWIDTGFAEIIGEQRSRHKGRPKQIFRMKFLRDL
jgi:GTP cyclohydrolase III